MKYYSKILCNLRLTPAIKIPIFHLKCPYLFPAFSDLKEKDYYLGLVDSQNTSLFSWLDGNLFGFSIFGRLQPSNIDICVRDYPPSYEWASVECFHPVNVMCKKSKGELLFCLFLVLNPFVYL